MSEYSKEYQELKGLKGYDFSILFEFRKLKEGHTKAIICEGFGTKAIGRFNGKLVILLMDDKETTLDYLIRTQSDKAHH